MARVLVTGANRGIGLALCKRLQSGGDTVVATCRHLTPELAELGVHVIEGVDVASAESVERLAEHLRGQMFDVLINNAGVLTEESLGSVDFAAVQRQMEINAFAPLRVTERLLPQLKSGAKVALITSRMGSVADNTSGGMYGYRMSKAALNAAGKSLAIDLRPRGIAVAILHPGYVSTDMTGGHGTVRPEEAARGLLERISHLSLETSGTFWHANGEILPW